MPWFITVSAGLKKPLATQQRPSSLWCYWPLMLA
ncbi:Uncharacterised protein [Vibrio cholerae]|nr:Uncharacterised protein [Vibrio cholerae]CSI60457.1 Uncharacterised protein [Vibrio cholerae]